MSRDPWPRDADASLHLLADAAGRIADTLDDFMDMSLSTATLSQVMRGDPDVVEALRPLTDAIQAIADRRAAR